MHAYGDFSVRLLKGNAAGIVPQKFMCMRNAGFSLLSQSEVFPRSLPSAAFSTVQSDDGELGMPDDVTGKPNC
jgi:hypothetical protein